MKMILSNRKLKKDQITIKPMHHITFEIEGSTISILNLKQKNKYFAIRK